ncbi:hypothetical protein QS795_000485 [Providencia zhijiangensis]|uniref:Uncharacterized protein n=1 Tax=Providencia zhijiangensis TaxID=3053982 RepID=A0ABZ0N1N3_9GAMM|nr:hypothetical protein [Providencia sp. D4759]WPA92288.1 hypothetical protein QS795_000485 [Providencia sp. D4759]
MKYKIINKDQIIGTSELERSDPPMGFVFGELEPTPFYKPNISTMDCKLYCFETDDRSETHEEILCEAITIDEHSDEFGEQCIEVTVLVESAEEFEKFFKHHLDAYERQFISINTKQESQK